MVSGMLCVLLLCTSFTSPRTLEMPDFIVLDPGHGGKDPGAVGRISKEKDIVLGVSLKLRDMFKNTKVVMTRETDKFVGLYERAQLANSHSADLFISIHANSTTHANAWGTETFALGLHREASQMQVMMKENAAILYEQDHEQKYDGFDPYSEESYIMFSLLQNAFLQQSLSLAHKIENQYKATSGRSSRGVKQAGFLVLWYTTMPAVLTEVGFMSNPTEEKFMASDEGQKKLATGLYQAIYQYQNSFK